MKKQGSAILDVVKGRAAKAAFPDMSNKQQRAAVEKATTKVVVPVRVIKRGK